MFTLRTQIDIEAPPEVVSQILTDTENVATWNPFIHRFEGELATGSQITVDLGAPGKSPMTFKPTVLKSDVDRELRWRGKLLVRGVFDGEHVFELQRTETGTRFNHCENFSALLVPFLKGMLERDIRPGFEAMNRALKQKAEQSVLAAR
jgi:hypothetical protein